MAYVRLGNLDLIILNSNNGPTFDRKLAFLVYLLESTGRRGNCFALAGTTLDINGCGGRV
jgi:hypothetical protein